MRRKLSVAFVLAPNFTLLALSAFVDTLRLAADEGDRSRPIHCSWCVLSDTMRPVRSSCGLLVTPDAELSDPSAFDYVVVVGGTLATASLSREMSAYLRKAADQGCNLVGICTGSFVLARLGLLKGRTSCVSWFHHDEFRAMFPDHQVSSEELFIVDGDRMTCAGGTSVVHLAAHLVRQYCGEASADKALRIMIEEAPLPAQHPQPQPLQTPKAHNLHVRKAMLLIERNIETPVSAEFMARHVGLSVRQLERLFKGDIGIGPAQFALRVRLNHARNLVVNGTEPLSDIAAMTGFITHSHFSQSFRKEFGVTPSQVRAKTTPA